MTNTSLHVGDTVRFTPLSDRRRRCEGRLLVQPWGRRKFAIVRDDQGQVHYLPSREHILEIIPQ